MFLHFEQKNHGISWFSVSTEDAAITDAASAMELAMTVRYETGCSRIAIDKKLVCGDFFILSTRLAGEILQKFINYRVKMAIYGDCSRYTSKTLRDFIYESNQGNDFFFVATKEEALEKLFQSCLPPDKMLDNTGSL